MALQYTPYVPLFLLTGVGLATLAGYALRGEGQGAATRRPLAALLAVTAVWATAIGFEQASVGPGAKFFWVKVSMVGVLVPSLWMLFVLSYTGRTRWATWRTLAVLSLPAVATLLLVPTDPGNLLWVEVQRSYNGSFWVLDRTFGPLMFVMSAYSYALALGGIALLLWWLVRHRGELYRGQILPLCVGTLAPLPLHAAFLAGVLPHPNVDVTPLGFGLMGAAITYGVSRHRLLDVVPVARDAVVEEMRDGYLVADTDRRLVDYNPAAADLLDVGDPVGKSVPAVVPGAEPLLDSDETETELVVDDRHLEVRASTLFDAGTRVGHLLTLRDVTERHEHREKLRRSNERLEEFASLVSHDLRNPLNVAKGYAEMLTDDPDPAYAAEVQAELERMDRLIDEMLSLARFGRTVSDPEPVSLPTVADRAWKGIDTGDGTLEVTTERQLRAAREPLLQLLENLFRNAAEHAGDAPTVTVGEHPDGFYVADDGPGVPEETDEAVFEPGHTTAADGTGYGLTVVADVAEAHGWTVDLVESESGGARFEFHTG